MRRRVVVVTGVMAFWVVGIEARLIHLQILRHADLAARAENQQNRIRELPTKRGDIVDRNGRVLATSVDAAPIDALPTEIVDPDGAAAALCRALADCTPKEQQTLA